MVNTPKGWNLSSSELPDVQVLHSAEDSLWYVETGMGIEQRFETKKEAKSYAKKRAKEQAKKFSRKVYYESWSKNNRKPTQRKIYRPD